MRLITHIGLVLACTGFLVLGIAALEDRQDSARAVIQRLSEKGLHGESIRVADFFEGVEPADYAQRTGAPYKPSFNEDPAIPAQCWIETGYGTQNACQFCHTDYLSKIGHGNAYPLGEDQILYSFPSPNLNRVLWRNAIFPQEIDDRLRREGIEIPEIEEAAYVRMDNWAPGFARARANGNNGWINTEQPQDALALFPALNPNHLFPYEPGDPTSKGSHGFVDPEGFVRDESDEVTGWRAINFFPYGIFTPMTGSVSGIYIRLPRSFMTRAGQVDLAVYKRNLDLLERQIKNRPAEEIHYFGDASDISVNRGFYPVGTEFAHPLHYVDLNADGQAGLLVDGVVGNASKTYEFPGTRAKRIKEMRYMYKWQEVTLQDIAEGEEEAEVVIGKEGQGWVENGAGWILSGFIEDRRGYLRPQTTEELIQCIGCHGHVGNTIDAVWSFQRKLPGDLGWREMDYGAYRSEEPVKTRLQDYVQDQSGMGELGHFFFTVIGADLYGVMPVEIAEELTAYARPRIGELGLNHPLDQLFKDEILKRMEKHERRSRLLDRQKIMRQYATEKAYQYYDGDEDAFFIKGNLFYPGEQTMKNNIWLYRKIVLDQSFNLGKDVFGSESDHVPFTFRSDGTIRDINGHLIPAGEVIQSRPHDDEGNGITPTGLVKVNEKGEPVDIDGNSVDIETQPERAVGHVSTGGTFDTLYNPILSDSPVKKD